MASTKTAVAERGPGAAARPQPAGGSQTASFLPIDKILPNSKEAEMAVLGAVLLRPDEAGSKAREWLTEKHFYYAPHQVLFREIAAMQDALQAIDPVTLQQRLLDKKLLDEIGGAAIVMELVQHVPTAANVEHYIEIVWEKYLLRQLIEVSHTTIVRAFEEQDDVLEWINDVQQDVFNVTAENRLTGPKPMKELVMSAMTSIERMFNDRGTVVGLATGFRDLDKITSGLHPGNMIVIAARPSMGKTSLAMNIAENVALDQGLPVGVFSLEMSSEELIKRMLCSRAGVNLRAIQSGFIADRHHQDLTGEASKLMKAKLYLDDTAGLTINQVRARARRMKLQFDIKLVVIDYLQLMRAPSRRADQSRQVEIADISSGIKALAKELSIPVVVLSQLNRQPEQREGGRPKLSDLRESGAIEQDADVVGLLVRPEVYADDESDRDSEKGKATLIIAKQRNGPIGDVALTFRHEFTRFENCAVIEADDMPGGEG
jgi:replicative DNA helicase